jgi:GNAT acetyltransferase-like protein
MPLYRNPDFQRLPSNFHNLFGSAADNSFFALPGWFDLMTRAGVPAGTEIRLYTDEQPSPAIALLFQTALCGPGRRLVSLANAYSVEHDILYRSGADLDAGLDAILAEILAERPRWDCLSLTELDPRQPSYRSAVQALRRAGLLVECRFYSGTWYEDTEALSFADYVAARPSELRNTWRRKRRRVERGGRLTKAFFADTTGINEAIIDYQTIYAASWKPPEDFPQLIPELIRLAAEFGGLRLGIYYIDGEPAAAQFWILWHRRAVIYKLAHDKRFDDLSLGTLLTMEMTERILSDDRPREITFGRGDDAYKKLWLPKRRERWGVTAANSRTRRGLSLGLKRQAAKAYHRLRGERLTPFD